MRMTSRGAGLGTSQRKAVTTRTRKPTDPRNLSRKKTMVRVTTTKTHQFGGLKPQDSIKTMMVASRGVGITNGSTVIPAAEVVEGITRMIDSRTTPDTTMGLEVKIKKIHSIPRGELKMNHSTRTTGSSAIIRRRVANRCSMCQSKLCRSKLKTSSLDNKQSSSRKSLDSP